MVKGNNNMAIKFLAIADVELIVVHVYLARSSVANQMH